MINIAELARLKKLKTTRLSSLHSRDKADFTSLSEDGLTVLAHLILQKNLPLLEYCFNFIPQEAIEKTFFYGDSEFNAMTFAAYLNDFNAMKLIHNETSLKYHSTHSEGFSVMHAAAQGGYTGLMQKLHQKCNIPYDIAEDDGVTPLHVAARYGQRKVINFLVDKNIPISSLDEDGWNVMHFAAFGNQPDTMKFLSKKHKMSYCSNSDNDFKPVHIAAQSNAVLSMKFLLDNRISYKVFTDHDGKRPMHIAAKNGSIDVMRLLHQQGESYQVFSRTLSQATPAFYAVLNNHVSVLSFLLEEGQDLIQALKNGQTLLHIASVKGHFDCVKFLLEKVKLNALIFDNQNRTALDYAESNNHNDIVAYIRQHLNTTPSLTGEEDISVLNEEAAFILTNLSKPQQKNSSADVPQMLTNHITTFDEVTAATQPSNDKIEATSMQEIVPIEEENIQSHNIAILASEQKLNIGKFVRIFARRPECIYDTDTVGNPFFAHLCTAKTPMMVYNVVLRNMINQEYDFRQPFNFERYENVNGFSFIVRFGTSKRLSVFFEKFEDLVPDVNEAAKIMLETAARYNKPKLFELIVKSNKDCRFHQYLADNFIDIKRIADKYKSAGVNKMLFKFKCIHLIPANKQQSTFNLLQENISNGEEVPISKFGSANQAIRSKPMPNVLDVNSASLQTSTVNMLGEMQVLQPQSNVSTDVDVDMEDVGDGVDSQIFHLKSEVELLMKQKQDLQISHLKSEVALLMMKKTELQKKLAGYKRVAEFQLSGHVDKHRRTESLSDTPDERSHQPGPSGAL